MAAFIAPPLPGNHASFLERLSDGTLVVVFFSGGEGQPGCGIAASVLPPHAGVFSKGVLVSQRPNYSNQNPVLYFDAAARRLHLYHTSQATGQGGGESTAVLLHLSSTDGAATWSAPELFYNASGAFTRNALVPLRDGGVLMPLYMSIVGTDYSFVLRADAAGAWGGPTALNMSGDLIQPTVVRIAGSNTLRAFFRDEDANAIYSCDSADEGVTWSLPARTVLPSNDAGIAARVLGSGALAMVYNNHSGTDLPRSPLVISLSSDDGASWPCTRVLEASDANSSSVGEYSYPAITEVSGFIFVSYTYNRLTILVRNFTEEWIRSACDKQS